MSRASAPGWLLTGGHLVIQPARRQCQLVRPLLGGAGTVVAAGGWLGTLLGPEGTGREASSAGPWPLIADAVGLLPRGRPYLENCTVDASI
jgi:hypothetical protein